MKDYTGQKFNRLTAIRVNGKIDRKTAWLWKCDCGNETTVIPYAVRFGNTKSCGCLKRESTSKTFKTHGLAGTRFYWVFHGMKARCYNRNHNRYDLYGEKGIKVEWASFEDFVKDMYASYLEHCEQYGQRKTTIERRDSNENYSKENCYWATPDQQANNTNRNHVITYKGRTQTLAQWCKELGLTYHTTKDRIYQGWSIEDAFERPVIKYQKLFKHA